MLSQAVEEGCHLTQPVTDLPPHTEHGQPQDLLEASDLALRHIRVHEEIEPEGALSRTKMDFIDLNMQHFLFPEHGCWRILCSNHQSDSSLRGFRPALGNLIGQVIKRGSVSEREEEEDGVHLFLTGLKQKMQTLQSFTFYSVI